MTNPYYDTRVLPVVRRAVIGLSLANWGLNRCEFDPKARGAAWEAARQMTKEELTLLRGASRHYQLSLLEIMRQLGGRGEQTERVALLLLAMYFDRTLPAKRQNLQEAS
jgi:hypothetical protein